MRSILKTDKLSEVEIKDFKRKLRQQILEHDHIILVSQVDANNIRRCQTKEIKDKIVADANVDKEVQNEEGAA